MPVEPQSRTASVLIARLARVAQAEAFATGLNPAQWEALRYFAGANRFSRTPSAFASFHGTSRGTASQTVRALVRKGLLERQRSEVDGRRSDLHLSAAGTCLLETDPARRLCRAIEALDSGVRAQLTAALESLHESLADAVAHFGRCRDCACLRTGTGGTAYHCTAAGEALLAQELDLMCINHQPGDCAGYPER